jgi:photosynthetic reaction center cytochrome c subunit
MNASTRVVAGIGLALLLTGCERPPPESVQAGFRGTGMIQVHNKRLVAALDAANVVPAALPKPQVEEGGPTAGTTFQNVQVLKDLPVPEFARLMAAITTWVSPQQGCVYCHAGADLASDALYTKVVARRMIEMTRHINSGWKHHVAETGVTCFTCHRGQNVPANIWFATPNDPHMSAYAGNKAGQNAPSDVVRLASLPNNPFAQFLDQPHEVRVVATSPLRQDGMGASIKDAEATYGLMMHMTQALGVNCTYCHNTRSFFAWDQSTPQRATAWYGIRLVRDLNTNYLEPLAGTLPANRHGAAGDGPKLDCATCHNGAFKPLLGVSMVADYPELKGGN